MACGQWQPATNLAPYLLTIEPTGPSPIRFTKVSKKVHRITGAPMHRLVIFSTHVQTAHAEMEGKRIKLVQQSPKLIS